MHMDTEVTVATLRQFVHHFVEERDWQRFHTPKNLAMSIVIKTAELMEHFQWLSAEESIALVQDETARCDRRRAGRSAHLFAQLRQ